MLKTGREPVFELASICVMGCGSCHPRATFRDRIRPDPGRRLQQGVIQVAGAFRASTLRYIVASLAPGRSLDLTQRRRDSSAAFSSILTFPIKHSKAVAFCGAAAWRTKHREASLDP